VDDAKDRRWNRHRESTAPRVSVAVLGGPRHSMIIGRAESMEPDERCPRCNAPEGSQRLLTSMARYYVCSCCECRWQVSRNLDNHEAEVQRVDAIQQVVSRSEG
jgi:hypothetical protein